MTKSQANILAKFIESIRPDWNFHGIVHALGLSASRGSPADLAVAMITAAADPSAETPGAVTNRLYWPLIGPTVEQDREARHRAILAASQAKRLKAEAEAARRTAATADQIRAIRNQATRRTT